MSLKLKSVWIVDDDLIARLLVNKRLQREGIAETILEFENGQEAYNKYLECSENGQKPDLILLDLNMPIMDGWAFLNALEEKFKTSSPIAPVAILTSSIDQEDMDQSADYANIFSFLKKPFNFDKLKADFESFKN